MILTLAWKEYREQRTIWLLLLALGLLAAYALVQIFGITNGRQDDLFMTNTVLLLTTAGLYGVVCASLLLAGEAEAGMQPFLHRHAGWRFRLWFGKLIIGGFFCAAFGLALAGGWNWLVLPMRDMPPEAWYVLLPVVAVESFAWGLLGGALMRTTMAAAIVSAVFVLIAWLLFGWMLFGLGGRREVAFVVLLGRVALPILALVLSAALYCDRDLRRLLAGGRLVRRLAGNRTPGGWLSLFWLTYRQTRWQMLFLGVIGLAVGLALPWVGVAGWGVYSVVLGVTLGVVLFAGDQPAGRVFLGERRPPPHRVWLAKMLFAAAFLAAITALITGLGVVHDQLSRAFSGTNPLPPHRDWMPFRILSHDVGPAAFAAYWLAYGFGVGQLLSFLFRKGLVALVLALLLGCLVPFVWVPSMIAGGVHLWQLFLPLVPLILATLLTMRAWLGDRLATRGPAFAVVGCALLTVLLTAAGIVYRVAEIRDVGEPFDVDAYRTRLSRERTGKLADAVKEAVSEFKSRRKELLGAGQGAAGAAGAEKSADQLVEEQLSAVVSGGATRVGKELAAYLDEMFRGPWVAALEAALRLPPEMLENPNTLDWMPRTEVWELHGVAQLLRARAVQLQGRGDQPGAVQQLRSLFQLGRMLRYRTILQVYHFGVTDERLALDGLAAWLGQETPPPAALLRSWLTFLADEERSRPSLREALKVEEVAERNMLQAPAYLRQQLDPFNPLFTGNSPKSDEYLALLVAQVPWEKERLRRRVNRFSRRLQGALEMPFPVEIMPLRPDSMNEAELRAAILENIERDGTRNQVFAARQLNFEDKVDLCRLRAARIQVALVLYQLEQGKTAPSLDALVPRYFDALPQDPYSGKDFRYRVSRGEGIAGPEARREGPGGQLGWFVWFGDAAAMAAGGPGGPGDAGGAAMMGGPGPVPLHDNFAVGLAGFIGLWAGPPGQNYLTPAWMLPGLDLGSEVFHPVRPGQGVLWSVGPDEMDNGGRRIASVNSMQPNAGIDLVFIVPDFVRGGNP